MRKKKKSRYEVLTWDMVKQEFTPQQGVRRGPYSLWGLKRALRKLQSLGYTCNRSHKDSDPSVLVQLIEDLKQLPKIHRVEHLSDETEFGEEKEEEDDDGE